MSPFQTLVKIIRDNPLIVYVFVALCMAAFLLIGAIYSTM
jgi:hypothetical protein